jgi:uncharacterized membrane protein
MRKLLSTLGGLGLGAGLWVMLDSEQNGRKARAQRRLKTMRKSTEGFVGAATQDLKNRSAGLQAEWKAWGNSEPVDDVVLMERVRARLGRLSSHPRAIKVMAHEGRITLSGDILTHEVDDLLEAIARVPGVRQIDDQLKLHDESGNVPALQGRPRLNKNATSWAPSTRLVMGAAGGALATYGLARRGLLGLVLGAVGLGVSARAMVNRPVDQWVGPKRVTGPVELESAIVVQAPREAVFAYLSELTNLAEFMSHVREVRDHGDRRSHFVVVGPAGIPVGFDVVTTRVEEKRAIAWRSVPGSSLAHHGVLRFAEAPDGGTHVWLRMAYTPPEGAVGQAVASLFDENPELELEADLLMLQEILESAQKMNQSPRAALS